MMLGMFIYFFIYVYINIISAVLFHVGNQAGQCFDPSSSIASAQLGNRFPVKLGGNQDPQE